MTSVIELSADRRDGLVEILNIANGRAAASLSKTVNAPITITVPTLALAPVGQAAAMLTNSIGAEAGGVSQEFTGPFDSCATLLFPRDKCPTLVNLWSGEAQSEEVIADLEIEVLEEIGNIVLYAAFGTIAKIIGDKFSGSLPVAHFGRPVELLGGNAENADETILLTSIDFGFARHNFRGVLCLILKPGALDHLLDCVDRFIQEDPAL